AAQRLPSVTFRTMLASFLASGARARAGLPSCCALRCSPSGRPVGLTGLPSCCALRCSPSGRPVGLTRPRRFTARSDARHGAGFTLIEVLIGLAVLVIALTAIIPSYGRWIMELELRNAAYALS